MPGNHTLYLAHPGLALPHLVGYSDLMATRNAPCKECDETGEQECRSCEGTGVWEGDYTTGDCYSCEGSGTRKCGYCRGYGGFGYNYWNSYTRPW